MDTFHASIKATLIPTKLDFTLNGSYSFALGRVEQWSPNATGSAVYNANMPNDVTLRWPAFEDTHGRVEAGLQYHISKNLTAKLFYVYEAFTKHSWQTDTLQPFLPNVPAVFLGQDWKNYWVQIVGLVFVGELLDSSVGARVRHLGQVGAACFGRPDRGQSIFPLDFMIGRAGGHRRRNSASRQGRPHATAVGGSNTLQLVTEEAWGRPGRPCASTSTSTSRWA